MKIFSKSGESAAGISVGKKFGKTFGRNFGLFALTIALVATASTRPALAARRHHAAAAAASSSEEESAASASNTALGAYAEACVLEPTPATVIFEATDHTRWPTPSLANM